MEEEAFKTRFSIQLQSYFIEFSKLKKEFTGPF